jgi:hypothetical protein
MRARVEEARGSLDTLVLTHQRLECSANQTLVAAHSATEFGEFLPVSFCRPMSALVRIIANGCWCEHRGGNARRLPH